MAKEQLAVIEMVTNMILGKTGGISKVDFVPQKIRRTIEELEGFRESGGEGRKDC